MDPMLTAFDREFAAVDHRSRNLIDKLEDDQLFAKPEHLQHSLTPGSCGEYILRSAAMVEKTFGGITTRLWDDPFEWTLPEELATKAAVLRYLDEVEMTRQKGFAFFTSDADLQRQIPAPEKLRTICDVLLDTLAKSAHFQGRAFAVFQVLTGKKLAIL